MEDAPMPDDKIFKDILTMKMPFGKYRDTPLQKLPVNYLEWFARKGFPKGYIGVLLQALYEIRINGIPLSGDVKY
ncbi:MAG: DUF3820 family protein [Niastella sp.]|nr:DUF3820 family protein [Niastella sp.]